MPMDETQRIALETIKMNKQALIFVASRPSAEKTAEEIASLTAFNYPELEKAALHAISSPTKQCRRLSHCLKKGIAFHHSGLTSAQRELVENEFRKGTIKIICATPTLAAGINMPAFRVIIKSLKRFSEKWGNDWIPVLEYLQMAGRAGRPQYESHGEAISIAKNDAEKEEIYERYILGVPEEIYSKLAAEPILRTSLLSLISSGIIRDSQSLQNFYSQTFWAHQYQDYKKLSQIMEKMLTLLKNYQFITIDDSSSTLSSSATSSSLTPSSPSSDFITASSLVKSSSNKSSANKSSIPTSEPLQKMRPTLLGKRISELYLDPLTARHLLDCLEQFTEKKNIFSLLQMISHTLEMRPLLSIKVKDQDEIQDQLNKHCEDLLKPEPSAYDLEYDYFLSSIKTALFFDEWIQEKDEEYLLEKYDIRPGEIHVKLDIAEWLLYASEEFSKITSHHHAQKEIHKLRLRLQYGVKEELLTLLKLKGIGRVRARKLYANGIKDIGNIKTTDLTTLTQILGSALAQDIKKQVGEEIKEIPDGKRKGQMSLGKYNN